MVSDSEAISLWKIVFFRDEHSSEPVKVFFSPPASPPARRSNSRFRLKYLAQRGLQFVFERADILDKVEMERGLYELHLDNTPNNPRVLLCSSTGRQIVLLHAFKKKGRRLRPGRSRSPRAGGRLLLKRGEEEWVDKGD